MIVFVVIFVVITL